MNKPDVILAFGFSREGEANQHIAISAKVCLRKYEIPIFTQNDVAQHLSDVRPIIVVEEGKRYLSTLGIVLAFITLAQKRGWKRVFVVAAPPHIWRCVRDLQKMGFEVFDDRFYFQTAYQKSFWYNRKDSQPWVRGPLRWWLREIILRVLPWKVYFKYTA